MRFYTHCFNEAPIHESGKWVTLTLPEHGVTALQ